ncbi:MAG: hypothetical protein B6A08_17105 [Sorangiineae bacterium NIC37A_2]|nr:MAG: hypothetical protein B6A08_17105 [Sorangiineae bacterium NIC37A_2]
MNATRLESRDLGTRARRACGWLIGCLFFSALAWTTPAQAVEIDICEEVITEVLVPPVPQMSLECNYGWHCAFVPHCCMPGLCLDPACGPIEKITGWTEAVLTEQVTFECRVENVDPKRELENWLRGHAAALDDAILPFVKDVVKREIGLAKAQAVAIPAPVQTAIDELTRPHRDAGQSKFRSSDISRARIISNKNPLVSAYLRDGFDAITLGDLVVLRDEHFKVLTDAKKFATAGQLQNGSAACDFRDVVLLIAHELVHVRQYAELGFDAFINNYLMEALTRGYGTDSFESEAYAYSSFISRGSSVLGKVVPNCGTLATAAAASGLTAASSGLTAAGLSPAAQQAREKLVACLDKTKDAKSCFTKMSTFYQPSAEERSKIEKRINTSLRPYVIEQSNGRLLKIVTSDDQKAAELRKKLAPRTTKKGPLGTIKVSLPKSQLKPPPVASEPPRVQPGAPVATQKIAPAASVSQAAPTKQTAAPTKQTVAPTKVAPAQLKKK